MILSHEQLGTALNATVSTIKLLDCENRLIRKVSAIEAVTLISRGLYEIGGSVRRVKYIRAIERQVVPKVPVFDPVQFRTDPEHWAHAWDGRAVIKWWGNQSSTPGVAV